MIRDTFSFVAGLVAGAFAYKLYSDREQEALALEESKAARQAQLRAGRESSGRAFEGSLQQGITFRPSAVQSGKVTRAEALMQAAQALGLNPPVSPR